MILRMTRIDRNIIEIFLGDNAANCGSKKSTEDDQKDDDQIKFETLDPVRNSIECRRSFIRRRSCCHFIESPIKTNADVRIAVVDRTMTTTAWTRVDPRVDVDRRWSIYRSRNVCRRNINRRRLIYWLTDDDRIDCYRRSGINWICHTSGSQSRNQS